ncbi:hypothetical protein TCE0_013f00935 [Talaromyces pinophilus]|uniref:Uncharacterized protein n=1 Tax=Talaromyces pinophilus TaxID=128442 RepID=A0A698XM59_TALPI|nr:hypothetical protein TCE0_013f00935 [Talaromyces pinophilus]
MGEIYPASSHAFIQATPDDMIAGPELAAIQRPRTRHFIVAVDFGTTFSSVSVYCQRDGIDIDASQINSISNYPGVTSIISQGPTEVPTQSWYPKKGQSFRQPVDTEINVGEKDDLDDSTDVVEDETMVDTYPQNGDDDSNNQAIDQEDPMEIDNDEEDFKDEGDEVIDRYYWGWAVNKFMADNDIHREQSRRIVRSKLLLDHSVHTKHIRNQLSITVKDLRARKLIRDETDIIADFLSHLLRHTKSQMEKQYDYRNECSVEFVLCVPAMWTEKACRTMQNAMTRALREAEFIEQSNHDVDNLFIVTEPEAASTHVLEKSREITAGDCFLLLDAGGGTVDAITYRVASRSPLRLEREEFDPEGALCGSSYLNEEFEKLLWRRLGSHRELEDIERGITIEGKINELLHRFETEIKRGVDIYSDDFEPERLPVSGLKPTDNEKCVAHGAVLRAANKVDGPERRVRSSYGIYWTELYEPTVWKAHEKVNPWHDPVDGKKYLKNTIDWIINKVCGDLLPSGTVIVRQVLHTFPVEPDIKFICQEVLCVSSKRHESHYRQNHAQNKGYEIAGHIIVDMTFLKDEPDFHPVEPDPGGKGRLHYQVEFELVIKIDGRNLRFEARYPAGEDGVVRGARQISIAASFQPGTE